MILLNDFSIQKFIRQNIINEKKECCPENEQLQKRAVGLL